MPEEKAFELEEDEQRAIAMTLHLLINLGEKQLATAVESKIRAARMGWDHLNYGPPEDENEQ